MGGYSEDMANIITPARRSEILRITLSTTARVYDMRSMVFGRLYAPDPAVVCSDRVMLRIQAQTADLYYYFAPDNTAALDKSTAIADAGAMTVATTYGDLVPAGTFIDVTIDRSIDKYLHVQGSAAGFFYVRQSSLVG